MRIKGLHLVAVVIAAFCCLSASGQSARRRAVGGQSAFVYQPANLDQVARVIPRGNMNAVPGGHVRPVKHMYVEYMVPRDGGSASLDVDAMAAGKIVMVLHRQTEACVAPNHAVSGGCASGPGGTALIDEYQIFIQYTDSLTSYYDHLHSLDARLALPDWRNDHAGWVRVGSTNFLLLGANGAMAPVRVDPGQRIGATRNYFTTWDIGVVDTRRTAAFLGTGLLRYPTMPEFMAALTASGIPVEPMGPGQPFPGEMFVNSACFTDYLTPPLKTAWRAKLAGDGSCGRPDWDVAGTLQGNWYRADVTTPTLENMFAAEVNVISFSPYNYDPANQTQIGFGANFLDMLPLTAIPAAIAAARQRLSRGLTFTTDRTPGTRQNPDPVTVHTGGYACFDAPDVQGGPGHLPPHGVVVYLPVVSGEVHLKVRYFDAPCTSLLGSIESNLGTLDWWGDYVR